MELRAQHTADERHRPAPPTGDRWLDRPVLEQVVDIAHEAVYSFATGIVAAALTGTGQPLTSW